MELKCWITLLLILRLRLEFIFNVSLRGLGSLAVFFVPAATQPFRTFNGTLPTSTIFLLIHHTRPIETGNDDGWFLDAVCVPRMLPYRGARCRR